MTTYKFMVPVKCTTLYSIKKKIFDMIWAGFKILWAGFKISSLALIGVLNGAVIYVVFNREAFRDYSYSASVGADTYFMWPYSFIAYTLFVDLFVLWVILDEYDIHFKIDCIRENKE